MAPGILNYFSRGSDSCESSVKSDKDETNTVRALPASWYTSQDMYELERRAIFSRKWLLVTHKVRLAQSGDFLRYSFAGFQILLCRDRDGNINGFHNVCRHRAYPVMEKDSGTAKILACKYHGWSYGLNGKLAKAPSYQDMNNYDKDKNGLLKIHVHVDNVGFIWINLDGKETPEIAWEDDFDRIDQQERFKEFNFENYEFDHAWQMDGAYNWKILADNFNECYHCPTTHPDINDLADLDTHTVHPKAAAIIHDSESPEKNKDSGVRIASTYCFPNASASITPHFIMLQKFLPTSPTNSTMFYEIYRNKHSSEKDFQLINQMYKRIVKEDKILCEKAQENLNTGVFVSGELHPIKEKGPLYFQKVCRDTVVEFRQREVDAKCLIWPAKQELPVTEVSRSDAEFCDGLSSAACRVGGEGLVW